MEMKKTIALIIVGVSVLFSTYIVTNKKSTSVGEIVSTNTNDREPNADQNLNFFPINKEVAVSDFDKIAHEVRGRDGKIIAYLGFKGKEVVAVFHGKAGKYYNFDTNAEGYLSYRGISGRSPIVSPNEKRITYVVKGTQNGKVGMFNVIDGREGKLYVSIAWDPVFSPDSQKVAYVVKTLERGKFFLVVNGVESKNQYDIITQPVFAPDSKTIAFGTANTISKDPECFLMINDEKVDTFPCSYLFVVEDGFVPVFSKDGKTITYPVNGKNKTINVYR